MRSFSLLVGLVVGASMVFCAGCIKVNVAVAVAPDQSTNARLTVATAISLAEMGPAAAMEDPFAQLKGQGDVKWATRTYQEGNWQVHEATGEAAPGQPLFPAATEGDSPKLHVQTSQRRLSTRYAIGLVVPTPPQEAMAAPTDDRPRPDEGAEMGQAFAGLAAGLMSQMEFRISLAGPGEVVATTGAVAAPGRAEWRLSFTELQEKKVMPDFRVTTELPNWDTIGKLANQIVMRGGPSDAGCRIADALKRGLLPNPPRNAAAAEKLSAADYQRLVEMIGKLDAGAGPTVTDVIIKQSRLNDEDTTAGKIAAAHEKIMALDVKLIVEQAAIKGISGALK